MLDGARPAKWGQPRNGLLPFGVVLNALLFVSTKPGTQTPAFFAGWFQQILDLRIRSDCGTAGSRMTFTPTWQTCGKSFPEHRKASPWKASQELSTHQRIMIAGILTDFRCSDGVGMFDLAARQCCFCWFSVPGCKPSAYDLPCSRDFEKARKIIFSLDLKHGASHSQTNGFPRSRQMQPPLLLQRELI